MWRVGPRQTEIASTTGITQATITTHESSSKKPRNQNAEERHGRELREVREHVEVATTST